MTDAPTKCPLCTELGPIDVIAQGHGFRCLACGESFPSENPPRASLASMTSTAIRLAAMLPAFRRDARPPEAMPLPEQGQPTYLPLLLPTGAAAGMPWVTRAIGFSAYDRPANRAGAQRTIDPRAWMIESFSIGGYEQFFGEVPLAAICDPIDRMMLKLSTIAPDAEIRIRARSTIAPATDGSDLAPIGGYVPEGRCLWLVCA